VPQASAQISEGTRGSPAGVRSVRSTSPDVKNRPVTLPDRLLQLQRTVGNATVTSLVASRRPAVMVQRQYIDNSDAFDEAMDAVPGIDPLTEAVFNAAAMLRGQGQAGWSATETLATLSEAQRVLEKWKFEQPDSAKKLAAVWRVLDREIGQKLTQVGALQGALLQVTGTALAEAKRDELERLAMRTVVANVGDYKGSEIAATRYATAIEGGDVGYRSPPPLVTEGVLDNSRDDTERNAVGVCTNFAYAAAAVLKNNQGVRVEVVWGKWGGTTGHT
jgi:hypothetical protein